MEKSYDFTSKLVGKAKKAAATLKGETGVFATLEEEHGEMASLMRQVAKTSDTRAGVEHRVALFEKLRAELLSHMRAEEATLYAVLKQHDETRRRSLRHMEDHAQLEGLLQQVDAVEPHELAWIAMFERLKDAVDEHLRQEESKLFPEARRLLGREDIHDLDVRFREEKERVLRGIDAGQVKPGERPRAAPSRRDA